MGKWDAYSRRELKRRRRAWARRNGRHIAVGAGITVAGVAGLTWLLVAVDYGPSSWYAIGAMHAATLAFVLHLLNTVFLAADQQAIWHVRGALGEENTREELRKAKKKGLIWDWVDSITFKSGDLDHLVVARTGGLIAIDSKWRNAIDRDEAVRMAASARRAQLRAEGVARTLLSKERGTHRARVQSLSATPLVVVWGAAQNTLPDGAEVDGAGTTFIDHLRTLEGSAVPREAARDVLEKMRTFRESSSQSA